MVARKLALKEGDRVLDVGCGWGSFPLWAATKHGASVVGITLSPPQAEKARQRAEAAGRRRPGRDPGHGLPRPARGERFDAIASIGMVEHVGAAQIDVYARDPRRPAGAGRAPAQPRHHPPAPQRRRGRRLLRALRLPRRRAAAPLAHPAGAGTGRLRHPPRRGLRAPTTPRRCATGRGASTRTSTRRSRLAGPERVRVWRLYLRAARNGFEIGLHLDLPGALHAGVPWQRPSQAGKPSVDVAGSPSRRRPRCSSSTRVAAGRDADDPDAGAVAGLTSRGVSPTAIVGAGSRGPPETLAAALDRLPGQLGAVARSPSRSRRRRRSG